MIGLPIAWNLLVSIISLPLLLPVLFLPMTRFSPAPPTLGRRILDPLFLSMTSLENEIEATAEGFAVKGEGGATKETAEGEVTVGEIYEVTLR